MSTINDKIDEFELELLSHEPVDCPLTHRFVGGMYVREIFMPQGSYITSLKHNTNHPFFVMQGKVSVISDNDGEQFIEAPYIGITTPGTRRVLYIHSDTIWVTVHKTDIKPTDDSEESVQNAVKLIGEEILSKYENPLLGGHYVNNEFIPEKKEINNY